MIAQFRMLTLILSGFITRRVMMPGDLKRMASKMQHFKYGMVAKESSVTGERNKTQRHRENNSLITATCTHTHTHHSNLIMTKKTADHQFPVHLKLIYTDTISQQPTYLNTHFQSNLGACTCMKNKKSDIILI